MGAAKKQSEKSSMLNVDEFTVKVLNAVASGAYDAAVELLKEFLETPSPYPQLRSRIERFINHSIDLVYAIRAKKNFSGMASLTRSKQQEISDKSNEHYADLQLTLAKIKRTITRLRNEDLKSTLWIVRAVVWGMGAIILMAFIREIVDGFWGVVEIVLVDFIERGVDWLTKFIR